MKFFNIFVKSVLLAYYKKLKKRAVVKEEPLKNFTLFSRPNDEEIFTF